MTQLTNVMTSLLLLCGLPLIAGEPLRSIRFVGQATLPGTASDLSSVAGKFEDGSPANRLGGLGSGIAWLGEGLRFAMISDRGPGDGATNYHCRFHTLELAIDEQVASKVTAKLTSTKLLQTTSGIPLIGSTGAFPGGPVLSGSRFDPEAIRVNGRGNFLIADEYGPSIFEFDPSGRQVGTLALPSRYSIATPAVQAKDELPPNNTSGRFANRGMESLAITPDSELVYGMMQGPLLQDGAVDQTGLKIGTNVRMIELQRDAKSFREFSYSLDHPDHGVSEIEWLAPGRLLVLERDGKPGQTGAFKRLYEVDLRSASSTATIEHLPASGLPAGVRPVTKTLFLDLLDPAWNLAGDLFPAKIEGVALGPTLKDGSRLLVISSDNDFKPEEPTSLFLFAIKANPNEQSAQ